MAPYFKYRAENKKGDCIERIIQSENPIAIAKQIKKKGYHITEIKKTEKNSVEKKKHFSLKRNKVDKAELSFFTEQFAIMTNSGLSIIESLSVLEEQIQHQSFKKSIKNIIQSIEQGSSLSESINKENDIFPYFYQQMIQIGEKAGILPKILNELSLYYKWQLQLKKRIINSLYYPILLLGTTFLTIIVLLTYVIPSFEAIFESFNTQLPYPTRIILFISKNMQNYFVYFILFIILFFYLGKVYFNTEKGSFQRDKIILKIPIFSKPIKYLLLWRFSNMLNLLIANGLSLLDSLIILEKIIKNKIMKDIIHMIQINIREGRDLSSALKDSKFFPKIMIKMVKIGEKTGKLDNMLAELAKFFHNKLNETMKKIVTILEPALIIFMAAIIAFVAISVLLPMFNMYSLF